MTTKNIGKYTLDDAVQILTKAVDAVHGEEKAYDLATSYIKWVNENYWHRYDKLNLQIATQAQKYIARLRAKQTRQKALEELIEERDALISDCEASRAELGLSILDEDQIEATKDKYGLDINDERDIKIPLEWEEVRAIGGTSQAEDPQNAYPVIDIPRWFEGSHKDRNITQSDLDRWTNELVSMLEEPVANNAKIAMRHETETIARQTTFDAVKIFSEGWHEKRAQILQYKQNVLSAMLIKKQIKDIGQLISDLLEDIKLKAGDEVTAIFDRDKGPLSDNDQPEN
jgi:cell division protein FtsB